MAVSYKDTQVVDYDLSVVGVAELLEEDNATAEACCTSANINKFSPYKPIVSDTLHKLDESEWVTRHYGVSISSIAPTLRNAAIMAITRKIKDSASTETGEMSVNDLLVYERPTKVLRMSDFIGYKHNAEQTIWGVTIDEDHYLFAKEGNNYSRDMISSDVGEFTHMGLLIVGWDGTEDSDGNPEPTSIAMVSGGLSSTKTFEWYNMGDDILQFAEDFFPVSESLPYVYAQPILMKAQKGDVTASDDDEIASSALDVAESLWDTENADLGDLQFIMFPLESVRFDYVAPVVTASLAWGDISKKTELLDNYLVVNMTYAGSGTISSCKITLNYDYLTDPETTVTDYIEKTNVKASFSEEKIYDGTPYQVRLTCEYVVDGVTKTLDEKTFSLL